MIRSTAVEYLLLSAIFCVACITYYSQSVIDRFDIVEQQLLQNPAFDNGGEHWRSNDADVLEYRNGNIVLTSNTSNTVALKQTIEFDTPSYIRSSIEASADNLLPTNLDWAGAGATISLQGVEGNRISSERLFRLKEQDAMSLYELDMYVPESIASVEIIIGLFRSEGILSFRNTTVSLLAESRVYKLVRVVLVLCWFLCGLCVVNYLYRFGRWPFVIVGVVSAILLVGFVAPEKVISTFTDYIGQLLPDKLLSFLQAAFGMLYDGKSTLSSFGLSKSAHFLVFFAIGSILGWLRGKVDITFTAVLLIVVAFATEALQMFVVSRSTSLWDIGIDFAGGLTGLCVGRIFLSLKDRQCRRST